MDYEKLYKEALERARNLHKDAIDMEDNLSAKQCEIIFPELRESEDDRIRKELLKHLRDGAEGYMPAGNAEDYTRCLAWAWLEPQDKKGKPQ